MKYPARWTMSTIRIYEGEKLLDAYNEIVRDLLEEVRSDRSPKVVVTQLKKLEEIRTEAVDLFKRWKPRLSLDSNATEA